MEPTKPDEEPELAPERARLEELTHRLRSGESTQAERAELALYAESSPAFAAAVQQADRHRELGGAWLARTEANARLEALERTPYTLAERSVGVGLVAAGLIGSFLFPPAAVLTLAGAAVLAVSVLRVKLKTSGRDPYDKIEK